MRLFPSVGAFIFWLIWPYVITRIVGRAYLRFTGRALPKPQQEKLRRELARITRAIMKPKPPEKEPSMPKSSTAKTVAATAVGAAAGSIITLIAVNFAFRLPADLKKYIPSKKM
jgi:hypothetical protein